MTRRYLSSCILFLTSVALLGLITLNLYQIVEAQEQPGKHKSESARTPSRNYEPSQGNGPSKKKSLDFAEIYEKTSWKFQYIGEQSSKFNLLVNDSTVDVRLANTIAAVKGAKVVDLDPHKFNSGSQEMDSEFKRQVAGSRVNEQLCGEQLRLMLDQMDEMERIVAKRRQGDPMAALQPKHLYLAQVLDSFGRFESGHLMGKTLMIGSHPQCSSGRLMLNVSTNQLTPTRYCLAKMRLDQNLDPSLDSFKEETLVAVAICIPESCHSLHSQKHHHLLQKLVNSQLRLPKSIYVEEHLPLESIFCTPDPDGQFGISTSGRVLIALLIGWLGLVIYATVKSEENLNKKQRTQLDRIFDALSLRKSWSAFTCEFEDKNKSARIEIDTLNPVKVLSCAFVVFGHSFMITGGISMDLLKAYRTIEEDPSIYFLIGGTVVTDTFYVVTGMILTYIAMKKMAPRSERGKPLRATNGKWHKSEVEPETKKTKTIGGGPVESLMQSLGFIASRYVRLMPLFYLAFWFKKSVIINMTGMGPLWDNGFNKDTESGGCREESWWSPVTFGPAYLPLAKQCLPHAWSVSGDLFFAILLGPIIVGLVKRPKLAIGASIIISVASNLSMYKTLIDIPGSVVFQMRDMNIIGIAETFRHYSYMYTLPHLRCFAVLIGAIAGYALYHYDQTGKIREWPEWFKGRATRYSFVMMLVTLFSSTLAAILKKDLLLRYPIHHTIRLLDHSLTTGRFFWDVANAIVFLRMATDWRHNFLMRNFSAKFWQSMVRLNYSILLIHMDVLMIFTQIQVTTIVFSKFEILSLFTSTYLICAVCAIPIYLVLECPIDKLSKVLLVGGDKSNGGADPVKTSNHMAANGAEKLNGLANGTPAKTLTSPSSKSSCSQEAARGSWLASNSRPVDDDMCTKI